MLGNYPDIFYSGQKMRLKKIVRVHSFISHFCLLRISVGLSPSCEAGQILYFVTLWLYSCHGNGEDAGLHGDEQMCGAKSIRAGNAEVV